MKKILKSKLFWVIAIIILIIVSGIVYIKYVRSNKTVEYVTEEVKKGSVIQTVSATGKVKSASEIELNFKNTGKLSVLNVKVGDKVKAGQVLAQLKATDLAINVSKARADLEEAKANLDKLKAGSTNEDIAVYQALVEKSKSDVASAQTDLDNAKATYNQALENERQNILIDIGTALTKANISMQEVYDTLYYEGSSSNFNTSNTNLEQKVYNVEYSDTISAIDAAELAYNEAKLNLTDEKIDEAVSKTSTALAATKQILIDLSTLFDYVIFDTTLTRSGLDTLKTTINTEKVTTDTQDNAVKTGNQDLIDARLDYQTKTEEAQNSLDTAEKNLAKAQADLEFKKAPARPEDVALYEARLKKSQSDLQLAQDKFDDTIIVAPIGGIITDVNFNLGEQTNLTEPVIKMLADEELEIEVDIPESDIVKLSVGDEAKITFDAFSDQEIFKGVVTMINPAQTEIQDVIYYRVTITLSAVQLDNVINLKEKIKPGMTANVTISTARIDNVLIIPLRATKEENGNKVVQILENNQPVSVIVTLGLKGDEGLVEVKSGLTEGQKVITFVRESK